MESLYKNQTMTTPCVTCKSVTGLDRFHAGVCPVRASFWCSQCGCYGHRPAECDDVTHVTRPCCLEDLIPPDVRERWGITTRTAIVWSTATLEDKEREVIDENTIEIRYRDGKLDSRLREVMRGFKIKTVKSLEGNRQVLREWAVGQGKKIRFIQDK
jgi:hypothetical protein